MPTRGRRELAKKALQCFLRQDYDRKSIVVVDDEEEPSFPNGLDVVPYFRSPERRIGAKRNLACQAAPGDIIMHFDSDDWSDPRRMADQVARLQQSGKMVAGYHSMFFYSEFGGTAYKYENDASYAIGTSLAYTRFFWENHPFADPADDHEDNAFVKQALDCQQLASVDAHSLMVARIHKGNMVAKELGPNYRPVSVETLPEGFLCQ